MADEEIQEQDMGEQPAESAKKQTGGSKLPWIILGILVPLCIVSGFFLGRVIAGSKELPEGTEHEAEAEKTPDYVQLLNNKADAENVWIYPIEPFSQNLNDPGGRRYVRVGFNLEISGQFPEAGGKEFIDGKLPVVNDWLRLYFSNLKVTDLQGTRQLRHVQAEIKDGLNEVLFPDTKPLVMRVLFSENVIQ